MMLNVQNYVIYDPFQFTRLEAFQILDLHSFNYRGSDIHI